MPRARKVRIFIVIFAIPLFHAFIVTNFAIAQNTPQSAASNVSAAEDSGTLPASDQASGVSSAPAPYSKEEITLDNPNDPKLALPAIEVPEQIYQLKKIDPNRIGVEVAYEQFAGVKIPPKILPSPAVGFGQRVEIYQEPKPVDSYMIMFKEMRHIYSDINPNWREIDFEPCSYRSLVKPLFVRAYGTEVTISDPKESSSLIKGQIKYTLDYRDVYNEYDPKFPDSKVSRWLQNDILIITMAKMEPIDWLYTSNVGFRYSTINVKELDDRWDFTSGDEFRCTYYVNQSLSPNPRLELFAQGEYFKGEHDRCMWASEPDHYLIAGELRMKSKDMKTSYTGRFSYSLDIYSPSSNTFEKYEIWARVGHDFSKNLSAYTMLKYLYDHTRSIDNAMWVVPAGFVAPWPAPFDVTAKAIVWENRAQARIYDKLWVQAGADLSVGVDMCSFDNIGILAGLEYYAPGIIRVDVGWRGNGFYNIDDFLSTIYFKCYFFM
ncbi:MAG: hypothetical protein JXB40_02615 [Candidatus Omnitrophica bacterium]|nr:hypothetical protein [Candidatus Omnitrophota bacterium]